MFIYSHTDNGKLVFKAIDDAAWIIATMWVKGHIKNNCFSAANRQFIISVTNPHDFPFVSGKSYHLNLRPTIDNGSYPYIHMALYVHQYVAMSYRHTYKPVADSVWLSLLGHTNAPVHMPSCLYYNDCYDDDVDNVDVDDTNVDTATDSIYNDNTDVYET